MFVNGPAIEISPFCFLVTFPKIYTAPGAAKIKPAEDERIAKIKPNVHALNSAFFRNVLQQLCVPFHVK